MADMDSIGFENMVTIGEHIDNNNIIIQKDIVFKNKKEYGNNLEVPVINFTDNSKYTRKTQWSLFPNSLKPINRYKTITYEIPCAIEKNPNEYYYPIHTKESKIIYQKYCRWIDHICSY